MVWPHVSSRSKINRACLWLKKRQNTLFVTTTHFTRWQCIPSRCTIARCRNITSEQRVFDSKETYCVQIKMLILSVTLKNPGQFLDDELEFCLQRCCWYGSLWFLTVLFDKDAAFFGPWVRVRDCDTSLEKMRQRVRFSKTCFQEVSIANYLWHFWGEFSFSLNLFHWMVL